MIGDKSKPISSEMRWICHFWDGYHSTTRKGKTRVPSQHENKRYERRWRRRQFKKWAGE